MTPQKPGFGKIIVGVAAAGLATGPTLILLSSMTGMLLGAPSLGLMQGENIALLMVVASVLGLIGALPAAGISALVLHLAARHDRDEAWLSAIIGALIGMLVAVVMGAGGVLFVSVVFALTGMLMGLLYWRITIRPRRRWRLSLQRDEEAIRAME